MSETAQNEFSRRQLLKTGLGASAALLAGGLELAAPRQVLAQSKLTPDAALAQLMDGNKRYTSGKLQAFDQDLAMLRQHTEEKQEPFAAVLSCADSRVPPEVLFDQSIGHIFVCRVAGNFATDETVASLEYAVAVLAVPLIFVLGHDSCGAVDAAIKSLRDDKLLPGHLPILVTGLAGAVKEAAGQAGDPLDNAIRQNVIDTVVKLKGTAPILNAAVDQNKLKVVGGIYRLKNGEVDMVA